MAQLPKSCIVAGATGHLGGAIARRLQAEGVELALAGRDRVRLDKVADELGAPSATFDARDRETCAQAVDVLATALGGDVGAIVVTCGVAAFGTDAPADAIQDLFAINALGPIALLDSAWSLLAEGASAVVVSAMVAEYPTAGLSHYSAAKAALSAYARAAARERRRSGVSVLDVRPPHLDDDFAQRALFGEPPEKMPEPVAVDEVAARVLAAMGEGTRELAWEPMKREPTSR